MGVRPAELRLAKWDAKMSGDALSPVTTLLKPMMKDQLTIRFAEAVAVENAVQGILAEGGSQTIQNGYYQSFGRQAWKAVRRFAGAQLLNEVDIHVNKWVGYGLDRDTLEKIRGEVFSLAPPAP